MSFPPYAQYKDSGVAWLGAVPGHWEVTRLRFVTQCCDGQRIPLNGEQRADRIGDVPYWGANAIMDYIDQALFDEDLVLLGEDGAPFFDRSKPVAFFSQGPVWPNNHIHVLRHSKSINPKFLTYCLNVTDYADFIDGSTRDKLTQGRMNNIPLPFPAIAEQEAIAGFLDREVGKIDGLVAEQERLIALLKEKRQAVISHAVTKGLNASAPLKDSGIEWLGQIPEHWEVKPLKYGISFIESGVSVNAIDVPASDDEIGVLKTSAVYTGRFRPEENKAVIAEERDRASCPVKAGCLIVSRMNTSDLVGATGLVIEDAPNLFLPDRLWQVHFSELEPAFTHLWTQSPFYRSQVQVACAGTSSSMQNLSLDEFKSFLCPFPPTDEQAQIAVRVVEVMSGYEKLMTEAQSAITLLQERRAALISAAVTGKIDVRAAAASATSGTTAEMETA
ncbi:restriction endonuclease subunit S [Novosphingobium umbonatum]|uniref:Restriction endonuclease subunit S n=1 Tax=Novosphingobium umbonatum TaxID=1908524 RepID=A0A3S2UVA1_9SPHN|nr:restriction endonuclease subunit S [Novosphingobium umbonatum]RVU07139.1 restriction endonuclease subunit S [Novosphingobium umbonatum]